LRGRGEPGTSLRAFPGSAALYVRTIETRLRFRKRPACKTDVGLSALTGDGIRRAARIDGGDRVVPFFVLVLEGLVGDNKAVSAPEMPANQIQDHSQLRGKSASEDEDDDEGRGRLAPLPAYVDAPARRREGALQGADRYRPRKRGNAPWLPAFGKLASDLLAQR
jgi:hypothetical protein